MKQRFIFRCEKAGVFFGELTERRGSEADIANVRRVYYWNGANSLSQLATEGLSRSGSQLSVTVPAMTVLGLIEVIPCSEVACNSLDAVPVWRV